MMRLPVVFAAFISVLLLPAWGPFGSDEDALKPYHGADAGRIVLSLGAYKGADFIRYSILFRPRGQTQTGRITYDIKWPTNFNDQYERGQVWTYALKPGDYEIYNFQLEFATSGGALVSLWNEPKVPTGWTMTDQMGVISLQQPLSIPFTVHAGETIYLGEFLAMQTAATNGLGMPVPAGAKFQLSNQSERDLPVAKLRDDAITTMKSELPDPDKIGSPVLEWLPGASH